MFSTRALVASGGFGLSVSALLLVMADGLAVRAIGWLIAAGVLTVLAARALRGARHDRRIGVVGISPPTLAFVIVSCLAGLVVVASAWGVALWITA